MSSWGLSLFVLFEPGNDSYASGQGSWGLSLFVLFEHVQCDGYVKRVLED